MGLKLVAATQDAPPLQSRIDTPRNSRHAMRAHAARHLIGYYDVDREKDTRWGHFMDGLRDGNRQANGIGAEYMELTAGNMQLTGANNMELTGANNMQLDASQVD